MAGNFSRPGREGFSVGREIAGKTLAAPQPPLFRAARSRRERREARRRDTPDGQKARDIRSSLSVSGGQSHPITQALYHPDPLPKVDPQPALIRLLYCYAVGNYTRFL